METKKPPRHKAQESKTIKRRAHGKRLFEDFSRECDTLAILDETLREPGFYPGGIKHL
jgi:hypothetical protein